MTLYKPLNFAPSSHYYVKNAHWIEWDTSRAVAHAVLQTQFPSGPLRTETTTITFSAPKHVCGVYTYTVFRAPGADATLEVTSLAPGPQGLYCVFIVG
jgi:hypothetical protein